MAAFGRGRALRRLDEADLVGFDLHLQNARLERQRAVLDSCDLGLTARTGDLDQVSDLNGPRGLGDGLRALVAHARSVARLLDVVHDLGALGVHLLGVELFCCLRSASSSRNVSSATDLASAKRRLASASPRLLAFSFARSICVRNSRALRASSSRWA